MLNIHSQYSLRYGLATVKDILEFFTSQFYPCFALTDINNTSALLSFVREVQNLGKPARVGIDFRTGIQQQFVGIAKNNEGFQELNAYLTNNLHSGKHPENRAPKWENCFVIYPWNKVPNELVSHEYIGVSINDINKIPFSELKNQLHKMVVLQPMTFRNKRDFNAHRLLRAVDENCLLSQLKENNQAKESDKFLSFEELSAAFCDYPEIIQQTIDLLEQCSVHFDFGEDAVPQNLSSYTGSEQEDLELLRKLAKEGVPYRYKEFSKEIAERIDKEIDTIYQKKYLSYFLITWDIVNYARSKGYFYVGRGSGANSIVAYLLRITDVDPIDLDLYFERFINLFRKNPPDFDMDFSWKDREDVTRYIFERFPTATLLCTYHTFQYKASIRELGKVFGLPKAEIDGLAGDKGRNPETMDHIARLILQYSAYISGLPSHLSIHAGGILISDKPITWYSATFMPPKGFPTTQFSMIEAEDVGLFKFDILAQRGLAKIQDCLKIAAYNQPDNPPHDIHDIDYFKEDEAIKQNLREGKAMGCFYVESPAMRMLLLKLKVDNYLTLVAASSIIRPGVAQSGMMNAYIKRHLVPERRKDAHPLIYEIMPDTYGVMVYQEDVIKVAHHFAGLSLAEADILRRGMSGKFRSRVEFERVENQFFKNCLQKGYTLELTNEIWRQIESFANYSFSKGHSASYAVESYQSLYLKTYYPLEYMVATLNNGGGFYAPEVYVHEAKMLGAVIEPPCINTGDYENKIVGTTIYLGFMMITGIDTAMIIALLEERERNGLFISFQDVIHRSALSLEQARLLIKIGAFRSLLLAKKELLWEAQFHLSQVKIATPQPSLFRVETETYVLPNLQEHPLENAFEQLEYFGFSLGNPFELLANPTDVSSFFNGTDLQNNLGKTLPFIAYLISTKQIQNSRGERMFFGTFLDIHGTQIDTVHFAESAAKFHFRGRGIYRFTGTVICEFGFYSVNVNWMEKEVMMEDVRYFAG